MPIVPVAAAVEVVLRQSLHGEEIVNVFGFRSTDVVNPDSMTSLGEAVADWWETQIRPLVAGDLSAVEVTVRDLDAVPYAPISITPVTWPLSGLVNSPALPSSVCLCVTHRTALGGRSYRGRSFMTGLAEAQVAGNQVLLALAGQYEAAFSELRVQTSVIPWEFAVISKYAKGLPRVFGIATPVVTSVVRDTTVDTQRRRLR